MEVVETYIAHVHIHVHCHTIILYNCHMLGHIKKTKCRRNQSGTKTAKNLNMGMRQALTSGLPRFFEMAEASCSIMARRTSSEPRNTPSEAEHPDSDSTIQPHMVVRTVEREIWLLE